MSIFPGDVAFLEPVVVPLNFVVRRWQQKLDFADREVG